MTQLDYPTIKRNLGGSVLEARAMLRRLTDGSGVAVEERRPFILFGRGRTGSTVLVQMLDSHPDVTCLGEILRFRTLAPVTYINNSLASLKTRHQGFKLLSYQVRTLCSPANQRRIRDWILENDAKIVHLHRDSLLEHAISNIYAVRRRVYHSTDRKSAQHKPIHIEPAELAERMDGSLQLLDFERQFLDGLPTLEIVYERDLEDAASQRRTYEAILDYLGLEPQRFEVGLEKVTPRNYEELISNWAEIKRHFEGTAFERYFA